MEAIEKGAGSFVAVIGEAGLGKSTLIAELKKSNEEPRCQWLRGDALSYARSISYFPWRQIIRQSIDAHEDDLPAEVRQNYDMFVIAALCPEAIFRFLEAMLAVESEESLQVVMRISGRSAGSKNGGCHAGIFVRHGNGESACDRV